MRRWLVAHGFRGEGTPPPLTPEVRIEAAQRYIEIAEVLMGRPFAAELSPPEPRLARNLGVA